MAIQVWRDLGVLMDIYEQTEQRACHATTPYEMVVSGAIAAAACEELRRCGVLVYAETSRTAAVLSSAAVLERNNTTTTNVMDSQHTPLTV